MNHSLESKIRNDYARGHDYLHSHYDRVRGNNYLGIVYRVLQPTWDNPSVRHWYSRVLHGLSVGSARFGRSIGSPS